MILRVESTLLCDVDGCTRSTTCPGDARRARLIATRLGWSARTLDGGEVILDRCHVHTPAVDQAWVSGLWD